MKVNMVFVMVIGLIVSVAQVNSASLVKKAKAQSFLDVLAVRQVIPVSNYSDPNLLRNKEVTSRPIMYEITKMSQNNQEIIRLASILKVAGKEKPRVFYSEERGAITFCDTNCEPLSDITVAINGVLETQARSVLAELIPEQSVDFVLANTEVDSIRNAGEKTGRILRMTYRFTRKLNGRHVIDNTAFVKISFSGQNEINMFEIVNPTFKPMALKRMIKLNVTEKRLQSFAEEKKTIKDKFGNEIALTEIQAEDGIQSYLAEAGENGKMILVPYVSFWSTQNAGDDISLHRYIQFCLDADRTPNLDNAMIEESNR